MTHEDVTRVESPRAFIGHLHRGEMLWTSN